MWANVDKHFCRIRAFQRLVLGFLSSHSRWPRKLLQSITPAVNVLISFRKIKDVARVVESLPLSSRPVPSKWVNVVDDETRNPLFPIFYWYSLLRPSPSKSFLIINIALHGAVHSFSSFLMHGEILKSSKFPNTERKWSWLSWQQFSLLHSRDYERKFNLKSLYEARFFTSRRETLNCDNRNAPGKENFRLGHSRARRKWINFFIFPFLQI